MEFSIARRLAARGRSGGGARAGRMV